MRITLNGTQHETNATTLLALLQEITHNEQPHVIAERNGACIDAPQFATTALHEGDSLEVLLFMGGG